MRVHLASTLSGSVFRPVVGSFSPGLVPGASTPYCVPGHPSQKSCWTWCKLNTCSLHLLGQTVWLFRKSVHLAQPGSYPLGCVLQERGRWRAKMLPWPPLSRSINEGFLTSGWKNSGAEITKFSSLSSPWMARCWSVAPAWKLILRKSGRAIQTQVLVTHTFSPQGQEVTPKDYKVEFLNIYMVSPHSLKHRHLQQSGLFLYFLFLFVCLFVGFLWVFFVFVLETGFSV